MLNPSQPAARSVSEYEFRSRRSGKVAKQIDDSRIHRNVPRLSVLRVSDDDEPRGEVEIIPLKTADFPGAHPGMERHSDYRAKMRCDAGFHKSVALLTQKIPKTRVVLWQELDSLHRALVEQFPVDRAIGT